jgi:integral membrane protein
MSGRVARGGWFALGWASVAVGTVGIVVPGLPTTVFFVIAAACFSRSSPRFERWVLDRPGVGPLVRDYRAGLGMPRGAKTAAVTSIAVVCSLSAFVLLGHWGLRATVLAAGALGIGWVLWRVPTRAEPDAPVLDRHARWFVGAATAEAITWGALLVGMAVKYVGSGSERGVQVFGPIHGVVVLGYVAITVLAAIHLAWGGRTVALALLASVPPFGTLVFESWARRTGRLVVRPTGPAGRATGRVRPAASPSGSRTRPPR